MNEQRLNELSAALEQQASNAGGLTASMEQLQSMVLAQQAAMYALIATHPNPRALFDEFATYLDRAAPADGEEPDHPLRAEMQRVQEKIRQAANRHPK